MRIDKFLSNAGIGSRNDVHILIKQKCIRVNGNLILKAGHQIDPHKDIVTCNDVEVNFKQYRYFIFNKPKGYVSANVDDKYPTIMDFFSHLKIKGLTHVGRLDLNTTGAILICNDGKLGHHLIAPKSEIEKIYEVTIDNTFNESDIDKCLEGIVLENDEKTRPAKLEIISSNLAHLTLHEGKYHEVKRMMSKLGHEVIELHRLQFSFLRVDDLKIGEFRELNQEEIDKLLSLCRL